MNPEMAGNHHSTLDEALARLVAHADELQGGYVIHQRITPMPAPVAASPPAAEGSLLRGAVHSVARAAVTGACLFSGIAAAAAVESIAH